MTKDEVKRLLLELAEQAGLSGIGPSDWASPTLGSLLERSAQRRGRETVSLIEESVIGAGRGLRFGSGSSVDDEGVRQLKEELAQLIRQITELKQSNQTHSESLEDNTRATLENTIARIQQSGPATAVNAGRALSGLGAGLTLSPLVRGLIGLVGGRKREEVAPLPIYTPPPPVRLVAAAPRESAAGFSELSYGPAGLPRRGEALGAGAQPQVTIHVQAIDSRSFLDHSESIARAVREAMLNMHSLNDVVADL